MQVTATLFLPNFILVFLGIVVNSEPLLQIGFQRLLSLGYIQDPSFNPHRMFIAWKVSRCFYKAQHIFISFIFNKISIKHLNTLTLELKSIFSESTGLLFLLLHYHSTSFLTLVLPKIRFQEEWHLQTL